MNLSYFAELPTAGSNLNHRFKVQSFRKDLNRGFRTLTGGRQFSDPANSLNSFPNKLMLSECRSNGDGLKIYNLYTYIISVGS